jgi:hypothetical protein
MASAAATHEPLARNSASAVVEGRPVAAGAVSLRAQAIGQLRNLTPENARKEALAQLVREQALVVLAEREGTVVSDAIVRGELANMRALAETAADDTGRQAFAKAAEQFGISYDAFFTDPGVIAAYQRAFTIADVRNRLQRRFGLGAADDAALDRSIDSLVQSSGIRIERLTH